MNEAQAILAQDFESTPLIDLVVFNGVKAIPGLMEQVVSSVNKSLAQMQQLRQQPQFTLEMLNQFGELAHGLKSGICMIGCARLALLCSKIEVCGRNGNYQSGENLIGLFDAYMPTILQDTMAALQAGLSSQ